MDFRLGWTAWGLRYSDDKADNGWLLIRWHLKNETGSCSHRYMSHSGHVSPTKWSTTAHHWQSSFPLNAQRVLDLHNWNNLWICKTGSGLITGSWQSHHTGRLTEKVFHAFQENHVMIIRSTRSRWFHLAPWANFSIRWRTKVSITNVHSPARSIVH